MVNGEVVCHDAVATVEGAEGVNEHRIGGVCDAVPRIAVADGNAVVADGRGAGDDCENRVATIEHCRVRRPMAVLTIGVVGIHPGVEGIDQIGIG